MCLGKYLKSGTEESSMRLGFILMSGLTILLGLAIAYQIIRGIVTDGNAIAAELAALAAFYTAVAYFKKEQKKIENNNSMNQGSDPNSP